MSDISDAKNEGDVSGVSDVGDARIEGDMRVVSDVSDDIYEGDVNGVSDVSGVSSVMHSPLIVEPELSCPSSLFHVFCSISV